VIREKPRCDINVTPLVDICLVLLIIFMVITPMIVERVQLPRTAQPDERKPKRSEQVRLVVGYPRGELWLEDRLVEESLLVEELKAIKESSAAKRLVLFADSRLDIAGVKRAIRLADRAGFHEFGCVVQKAAGR